MNEKIAWVTDTSALLDEAFIKKFNIHVIPASIIIDEISYRETAELSLTEFYDKMRTAKTLPKTAQPIYGELINLYKRLKEEGYTCGIAVHPSSNLSGTYASSINAAKEADFPLFGIDSKICSYPIMKIFEKGHELASEGATVEAIAQELRQMPQHFELYGVPANLTQLHKSGRLPGVAAFLGNLLKIKLVISFKNGNVVLNNKVRTIKRAKDYVTSILSEDLQKSSFSEVAIVHCNNELEAKDWKEELQDRFPSIRFITIPLSAAIAVHTGEGTTGLSWVRNS